MILNHRVMGQGPPLMILHGLFGSLDNWSTIGRELANTHTVYLTDLRNHGKSFHHDQFDYDSMAEDIRQLIDHSGLSEFDIVGHSMGGKAAMFFAKEHPEMLNKLAVVDIGPKYYPVHHQVILQGLLSIDPDACTSRGQADQQLSEFVKEPGVRQFLLKNLKRSASGNFEWKMNLPVINQQIENVGQELNKDGSLQLPTLFIRGGSSDYILDEDIELIEQHFSHYVLKTVPNVGHWVHAEAPAAFLKELRDFIDQS